MTALLLAGLFAAGATIGSLAPSVAPPSTDAGEEYAQLTFHSRVVVRVETARARPLHRLFREKKGPRCVPMADIAGSAVLLPNSVDIALRNGDRVRAQFAASCPGLDYYSGFYVVPNPDGKICADRDVVRDRAGGECSIGRFRKLVPPK